MTRAFDRRAYAATGTTPAAGERDYRVSVGDGRFRIRPAAGTGTVLDVALDGVRCRPLGRAGVVVVRVRRQPLLLDFTDRSSPRLPARVAHGVAGRLARRAFLTAVGDGSDAA